MTESKQRRKPHSYTDELKKQLVDLYHLGKHRCDCILSQGVYRSGTGKRTGINFQKGFIGKR